jgi:hypothetical protein
MLKGQLVVEGDWRGWDREILDALKSSNTDAMRRAVDGVKQEMRRAVQAAGLGRRLGFTIGSDVYPKGRVSLEPAGVLYPRGKAADTVLRSYIDGATIRSKRGWLAIPIRKNLPVLGRNVKPTPELVEQRLGAPLRWVAPRGRNFGLLVADNLTRGIKNQRVKRFNPRAKKARKNAQLVGTLPMFVLVKQVQVRKRLEFGPLVQRWIDQLPRLVAGTR